MKPEDISAAARALGSIKSPRKTESSRKNAARASKSRQIARVRRLAERLQRADAEVSAAAATMGRKGGKVRSERKTAAVRQNGRKGGRPKAEAVTLRNPFHGTETTINVPPSGIISARAYTRARLALCPVYDCKCFSASASGRDVLRLAQAEPQYRDGRLVAFKLADAE